MIFVSYDKSKGGKELKPGIGLIKGLSLLRRRKKNSDVRQKEGCEAEREKEVKRNRDF
jgi:hypothetical protein